MDYYQRVILSSVSSSMIQPYNSLKVLNLKHWRLLGTLNQVGNAFSNQVILSTFPNFPFYKKTFL